MSIFSRSPGTALAVALPEPNLAAIPEPVSDQGMSVAQFTAILLAYWMQIIVIAVLAAILSAVFIKWLPKTYTATATLIVSPDVKDPLAGRDIPEGMLSSYVSTQIELMTSPIVLVPVVQQLNLMQDRSFGGGPGATSAALEANVRKNLAAAVKVERGTGGQLLYVSASSKDAGKAAAIANAVADVYIEQDRHRLNSPATERAQRYTEELAELREKTSIAEEKVAAFGKANGIADLSAGTAGLEIQTLDSLHQRLLDAQNFRRNLEANQVPDSSGANAARNTQATLDTELWQLSQLSKTYGPEHPKIKELNAQIALTRQTIANQNHALSANTSAELAQTKDLERKYAQAIAEQEVKVAKIRQAQADGAKLLLELESAKAVYKQALDGFDQIMFQAVANHANVSVVSRAVPPLRPSKPNKMKLLMMALVGAAAVGVAIPLAWGLFVARRLRCRDDMERDFGIAVLAQLEAVPALARAT